MDCDSLGIDAEIFVSTNLSVRDLAGAFALAYGVWPYDLLTARTLSFFVLKNTGTGRSIRAGFGYFLPDYGRGCGGRIR